MKSEQGPVIEKERDRREADAGERRQVDIGHLRSRTCDVKGGGMQVRILFHLISSIISSLVDHECPVARLNGWSGDPINRKCYANLFFCPDQKVKTQPCFQDINKLILLCIYQSRSL